MKIAKDKWKHFFVGIVMGAVLQAFFLFLINSHVWLTVSLAVFFSIAIGYGFELFSKLTGKGHYDLMDVVADIAGAVLGIGSILLVHLYY